MEKKLGLIKIEDVMELVKLVHRANMETDNFVSISYSINGVDVFTMKGEFDINKDYVLNERFVMYDPWIPEREAETFCKIRNYLKELLGETDG